jgi:thiamine monophosphate synthase
VLEEVKKHIKIPICVIGGINHENIKSFNKIKPDMISMISGIFSEQKPSKIVTIMNTFNE